MARSPAFRVAPFKLDVTPPIGMPLAYGVNDRVHSPVFARGLVLDDGKTRAMVVVVDHIFVCGGGYRQWKRCLSKAAGVSPRNLLLHSVHQHDSPWHKPEADAILRQAGYRVTSTKGYWDEITAGLEATIASAVRPGKRGAWRIAKRLGTAERRVSGLSSNRRLVGDDGKVWAMRWSSCSNPRQQAEPVGKIDPLLRTIGFLGARDEVIASLHFYASHPVTAYRRNMVGSDVSGVALNCLSKARNGEGHHMYLVGCGGDSTFGKYTFADKEKSLQVLGRKLGANLVANVEALGPRSLGKLSFAHAPFIIPFDPAYSEARLLRDLRTAKDEQSALHAARRLAILRRKSWHKPPISRMTLAPDVHMLSMPSEVVVEYQLYAQRLIPEQFLACAAYGDGTYFYIPTAAMYEEGGYEPTRGFYLPSVESALKGAIARVIAPLR